MDNFRAIAIGIEEYLHYQPLTGAENNAQALYRYFFEEANIPCHQLLLLTDTSPLQENAQPILTEIIFCNG